MSVTANVTRDTGRTSGVTHGPITRSDPIRSDPALLQLLLWSPSHHGVQKVSTREAAPVVAPSPVATPDDMMGLAAIEHLDFQPELLPDWIAIDEPQGTAECSVCRVSITALNFAMAVLQ